MNFKKHFAFFFLNGIIFLAFIGLLISHCYTPPESTQLVLNCYLKPKSVLKTNLKMVLFLI